MLDVVTMAHGTPRIFFSATMSVTGLPVEGSPFLYQFERECLASVTLRGKQASYDNGILIGKRYYKLGFRISIWEKLVGVARAGLNGVGQSHLYSYNIRF